MFVPLAAMATFIAVFALATARRVHLGILMLPAACVVGVALAGMPLRDVVGGFPVSIMLLVAGVTYFFGIAQINGTIDRVIGVLLARTGARPAALPVVFFALTAVASAMGSPQAGLVLAPLGMPTARRAGVDPVLMAIAINSGISAGAFAPTSLFGIVTYRIARQAGIDLNPFTLLAVAVVANLLLLIAAVAMFGGRRPGTPNIDVAEVMPAAARSGSVAGTAARLEPHQVMTIACMVGVVVSIIGCALLGIEPDIGVIALGFGAVLTLIDPTLGARAFAKIDWSTSFVVGGIVTYVGVLQKLGSVDLLGRAAIGVGTPLLAALVVCMIAALVSAFASTTGVLAALVPLAVPLAASGEVAGWALITALGVMRHHGRCLAVLQHRGDVDCLGSRGRSTPAPEGVDAVGHVDDRRWTDHSRTGPGDAQQVVDENLRKGRPGDRGIRWRVLWSPLRSWWFTSPRPPDPTGKRMAAMYDFGDSLLFLGRLRCRRARANRCSAVFPEASPVVLARPLWRCCGHRGHRARCLHRLPGDTGRRPELDYSEPGRPWLC